MNAILKLMLVWTISVFGTLAAYAGDEHDIPLKLFGKNVVQDYDGCFFALWQQNRDPETDKYSYVFFAPIADGGELPGWIKIGDKVYEAYRQDVGYDASGGGKDPYQLFKVLDEDIWLILEIFEQRFDDQEIIIEKAELTFVQSGHFPFVSVVKGKNGCPASFFQNDDSAAQSSPSSKTYTSLDGDPIDLSLAAEYNSLQDIPIGLQRHTYQYYESCDMENTAGASTKYEISSYMSLWQTPCALYASNATSNFFTVANDNQEHFGPLYAVHPPGLNGFEDGDLKEMLNAYVVPETGSIIAWENNAAGNCGSYWKYQLRAVEGEAVEAFLVEYRTKQDCEGPYVEPENMPAVYIAD